ncbi:toll-like receptor Tollo [Branchiostoma floridae]|uniref:Toll-like receptor Tollo n=3 Tax=Branchiostoma floridae TaxID=7739 RepID=A0A9J7LRM7_BRAFL|nr:toll-like receptor Tollo [Branchiostoma floridae]
MFVTKFNPVHVLSVTLLILLSNVTPSQAQTTVTGTLGTVVSSQAATVSNLDLSNRSLSSIPPFNNPSSLQEVDLSNNHISYLNGSAFAQLVNLEDLNLRNNLISTITVDVFSKLSKLRFLDLAENSLTDLPDNLFMHNGNLTELRLGLNNISAIGRKTFTGLSSLQKLFLNNGGLSDIDSLSFAPLVNVEEIYLQDNNIINLPRNAFHGLQNLKIIDLRGNSLLSAECNCDQLGICVGTEVQSFSVTILFTCLNETHEINMTCQAIATSENCAINNNMYILAIVLSIILLILTVLLLVLYRYRTNLQVWFITRYQCCRSGRVEDKPYDVFIYNSSEDQGLVVRELAPGLEKRGFKLCLEYRDFPVGACIASTIIESVEASRRTVLILSQSFVDCEWCALAFKASHQQMLKDKQRRIVVITLDGPKLDNVDKDLQFFLGTNECLKWGEPQFWDKLSFALSGVGRGAMHRNMPSDIDLKHL